MPTRNALQELKKSNNKCHICSRKGGVVVPCSHARSPCERWMHPMCAAQNNRYSRRLSPEEAEASRFKGMYAFMCNDHVPPCLRHVSRCVMSVLVMLTGAGCLVQDLFVGRLNDVARSLMIF